MGIGIGLFLMGCRYIKKAVGFRIVLFNTLPPEILSSQGVGCEGVILVHCLPEPPCRFLVTLLCTMSVGIAFPDPVPQVSFLLRRHFRRLKGFQRIPEPPLCFFLIFLAALPQQVHPTHIIAGISVPTICFQEK